ncbi:hypothetical protein ACFOTA_24595 [Chitinophaga sp. GCM10012297]|uniref:Outer membrane protein beta-barrel domain-containing protein n=1 Tax=Chitinophaga chungangae TaxID=2821488 RepID=A0ABS3YL32_9BACT|nr:hypothetical protein [Chitinophaga chungangae]MBO9155414.1 hypothetical protein [Chitinophaga chungangae]
MKSPLLVILTIFITAVQAVGQSAADLQNLADLERQLDSLLNRQQKNEWVIGLGFGNNPAYGGKTTDAFRPVNMKSFLSPNVSYNHKSGLYASTYAYYMLGATQRPWFELDLSGGYDYTKDRNFLAGASYTKYFYRDSTDVPPTPITNELFAYFFWRKWWLEPGVSFDFGWGRYIEADDRNSLSVKGNDFNIIVDVRHPFIFLDVLKKNDAVLLMPVASLTSGTAKYFSNLKSFRYVSRSNIAKKQGRGRRRRPDQDVPVETALSDGSAFRPRAVDFGVRASYIIGKVAIAPSYTVFKLLQGEDTSITGYFTASVSLTL